jgi:hypothetical protein
MRWELWGFWRVEGLDKENRGQGTGKNREEQGRTGKNREEQGRTGKNREEQARARAFPGVKTPIRWRG